MNSADDKNRAMIAFGLILVGAMALMGLSLLWPLLILVPGLLLLLPAVKGGPGSAAVFAIPGAMIAGTGALMFIQNLTGYWDSWAYAWTLYGAFLGGAFMLMGQKISDGLEKVGRVFVQVSLVAFVALAILFEVVFGMSGIGPLGALLLIGLGIFLLTHDKDNNRLLDALKPSAKAKHTPKLKHEALFTGPVVYGTRASEDEIDAWRKRQAGHAEASASETDQ